MARTTLIHLLSLLALHAFAQTPAAIVSQISDGQVQALPSVGPAPLSEEETTSTTSETRTTSATISLPLAPALNSSAVVAPVVPSTSATPVPTSILVAAPAGAPGAASNYTGLETVEAAASLPTPSFPIPVSATALAPTTAAGLNGTVATALAPTIATEAEAPESTTTEEAVPATGMGVRVCDAFIWKEMVAAGVLVWILDVI